MNTSQEALKKASEAVKEFEKTREINPILYPYFAQDGKWWGFSQQIKESKWEPESVQKGWKELQMNVKLKKAILKDNQIQDIDSKGNQYLKTSYVERGKENKEKTLTLDYYQISGSLVLKSSEINAPNLKILGGDFRPLRICQLRAPKLEEVSGDIQIEEMKEILAPNLWKVGGNFSSESSAPLPPKLREIGGTLSIKNSYHVSLPELESVGHLLYCKIAISLEIPKLKWAGKIEAPYIKNFYAPELTHIDGNLRLRADQFDCPKLKHIEGHLDLKATRGLKSPKLESIGGNLKTPHIQKILCPKLRKIGGAIELPGMKAEEIQKFLKQIKNLHLDDDDWSHPIRSLILPHIQEELNKRKHLKEVIRKEFSQGLELEL